MRITGHCQVPLLRQYIEPSSEMIWLKPSGRKSANWMKATGFWPVSARPMAVPMIVDSDSGALRTRPGKAVERPRGDAEDVALGVLDVLAQKVDLAIGGELVAEHAVERLAHAEGGGRGVAPVLAAGGELGGVGRPGGAGGLGSRLPRGPRRRPLRLRRSGWSRAARGRFRPSATRAATGGWLRAGRARCWRGDPRRCGRSTGRRRWYGPTAARARAAAATGRGWRGVSFTACSKAVRVAPRSVPSTRWISRPRKLVAGPPGRSKKVWPGVRVEMAQRLSSMTNTTGAWLRTASPTASRNSPCWVVPSPTQQTTTGASGWYFTAWALPTAWSALLPTGPTIEAMFRWRAEKCALIWRPAECDGPVARRPRKNSTTGRPRASSSALSR